MISIINQIVSFPIKTRDSLKNELDIEYETAIIIDKKQIINAGKTYIEYELILKNGYIYETCRTISDINTTRIKILSLEEQLEAFNNHFYKFINPPEHLEKHLIKK